MKKMFFFLIFSTFLALTTAFAQVHVDHFLYPDSTETLRTLFGGEAAKQGGVIWEPSIGEVYSFGYKDYQYFHTQIDSIIYWGDLILVVYSTAPVINGERYVRDCRGCGLGMSLALFSKTPERTYALLGFNKYMGQKGVWGELPKLYIQQIQNEIMLFEEITAGNHGYFDTYFTIYSLDHWDLGNSIFSHTAQLSWYTNRRETLTGETYYEFCSGDVHLSIHPERESSILTFETVYQCVDPNDQVVCAGEAVRASYRYEFGAWQRLE